MKSKPKEFITTEKFYNKSTLDKYLFAGEWCFKNDYSLIEKQNPLILENPIKTHEIVEINDKIYEVYEILLDKLTKCYNEYFQLDKPKDFYKIILGRWLFIFLNNVYEKTVHLKKAAAMYPGIFTKSCGSKIFESFDSEDYNQKSYFSPFFNFYMYSSIAEHLNEITTKNIEINNDFNKDILNDNEGFKDKLIDFLQNFQCVINNLFNKKMILVSSPNYPKKGIFNVIWFFIFSKGKVVHYRFKRLKSIFNKTKIDLRNLFKKNIEIDSKNQLLDISSKILFSFMPNCFLEDFSCLRNQSVNFLKKNKNCKIIFTTNAIHSNEKLKYLAAENINKKLWVHQHGFGYGALKILSSEIYERSLSNRYFSWGWGKESLPNPILSSQNNISYSENKKIVLTLPSYYHYSGILDYLLAYKNDANNSIDFTNEFISKISLKIKNLMYLREQKGEALKVYCNHFNIKEDFHKSFHESLLNSRIHISNHFGTPFLESMAFNYPTIIILNKELSFYLKPSALKDFEKLSSINIIFTDINRAAEHLNNVYENIDSWWLKDENQIVVKKFNNKYAMNSKNWRRIWLRTLLNN